MDYKKAYGILFNAMTDAVNGIGESKIITKEVNNGLELLNCTPFVRQYDILNNKWGALLCQKEYQTNVIHQNSRNKSSKLSHKVVSATRKLPGFTKFKGMTAFKVGNGSIWKKDQKVLLLSVEDAEAQVNRGSCQVKRRKTCSLRSKDCVQR